MVETAGSPSFFCDGFRITPSFFVANLEYFPHFLYTKEAKEDLGANKNLGLYKGGYASSRQVAQKWGYFMLKIINAADHIADFFPGAQFSIEKWNKYADAVLPLDKNIFINDMQKMIRTGGLSFENDYLPVLNEALMNKESRAKAVASFHKATDNLEEKIRKAMGRSIEATIVLYMGLCNGAGWVVESDSRQYVLLGIEKIVELGWYHPDDMYGLIYHELGHIYQMQYGQLKRSCKNSSEAFLWQLFTEGIAMLFEQKLIGNKDYFHQDKNGWADWCAANLNMIIKEFDADLNTMTRDDQRYFGDWVNYKGYHDVGYYLGARFVQWLNTKYPFDEMLNFDIKTVQTEWKSYHTKIARFD